MQPFSSLMSSSHPSPGLSRPRLLPAHAGMLACAGTMSPIPDTDPVQFLEIAGQGASLVTHADLWRWLQGDVQKCLEHDVLLIGWGDFHAGDLRYDVVSSLPGVRSHTTTAARLSPLISYLRDCWVAAQQVPCQLDMGSCGALLDDCAKGWANQSVMHMKTALVHGTSNGKQSGERIYVALSNRAFAPAGAAAALKLLLPFIETALRRMPPPPVPQARLEGKPLAARMGALSERERQIMDWVALGKTNPEIGCILGISEFTVKNHMKSIFGKLDVTNRAQAVATVTRIAAYA